MHKNGIYAELNRKVLEHRLESDAVRRAKRGCGWNIAQVHSLMSLSQDTLKARMVRSAVAKYFKVGTIQAHIGHDCSYEEIIDYLCSIMGWYERNDCNYSRVLQSAGIRSSRWSKVLKHKGDNTRTKLMLHEYVKLVNVLFNNVYVGKQNKIMRTNIRNILLDYLLVENRLLHIV